MAASGVVLGAPFAAWLAPLDEVPDEVFATRMLGDGVALDPLEGTVSAPCDGVVIAVAPTNHSVTIRTRVGADVLIHVGIDTVAMAGAGFRRLVSEGDAVVNGGAVLAFDLDAVARTAPSARTPMIIVGGGCRVRQLGGPRLVRAGEPIMELLPSTVGRPERESVDGTSSVAEREVIVAMRHGIHARPAARIVAALRPFAAVVEFRLGARSANARSVTATLGLGVQHGDLLTICGSGEDAALAVTVVSDLILGGMGEGGAPDRGSSLPVAATKVRKGEIGGVRASPGGAVGAVFRLRVADRVVPEQGSTIEEEERSLIAAIDRVRLDLRRVAGSSDIAEAHVAILDDPDLLAQARRDMLEGASAAAAWRAATRAQISAIAATGNQRLMERSADLRDVERQLVDAMLGTGDAEPLDVPQGGILVAAELLPTQLLAIPEGRVAAILTAVGGPTSHVAIIAAARGIPMIVSAGDAALELDDGMMVIVEEDRPVVRVAPDAVAIAAYRTRLATTAKAAASAAKAARAPAHTADGARIEVFANCGSSEEAELARSLGAEGCGLLRTEFLFMDRQTAPSEQEQAEAYSAVAAALGGLPVIVRTLDAGSDKPIPYVAMAVEENPALGMRGVRVSLARPDLLRAQLRAILNAIPSADRRIMLPMVNDLADYRAAAAILREEEARLNIAQATPLGIMIETPAAAMLANQLAREAAFLSIGTNDLVQYALAADRGNEALAASHDALHPAVLRLIAQAVAGAHAHGRWLGVCGALASDAAAAPLLVGLGVDELSATPRQVPAVKASIARHTMKECRELASQALDQESAAGVRRLLTASEGR